VGGHARPPAPRTGGLARRSGGDAAHASASWLAARLFRAGRDAARGGRSRLFRPDAAGARHRDRPVPARHRDPYRVGSAGHPADERQHLHAGPSPRPRPLPEDGLRSRPPRGAAPHPHPPDTGAAMLTILKEQPADKILQLIAMFRDDPRGNKIDLGIGVYRDAEGRTPVMRAVKQAERMVWETQTTKAYTGLAGDPAFGAAMQRLVLGDAAPAERVAAVATPGGTGAVRQALELV